MVIQSTISSTGNGVYSTCSEAFLFSIVNPPGMGPTKLPLTGNQQNAIYCKSSYGPTFGGWHDLHISDKPNTNTASYSHLGYSYEHPAGQETSFLSGTQTFSVTDYEVFGLHM